MKFCPECGAKLVGDAPKFCGECGHKLVTVEATPAERPNSELSDEELRAKADAGDAEATKDVGLRCWRAGDSESARQWYERAASLGHAGAMRNLGILRKDADDQEGALAWFTQAAYSGSDLTMDRDSTTVRTPVLVSARAASQAAVALFKMDQLDEAEQWIKRSKDMGDDQAVPLIANYLIEVEDPRALEWCKRASGEGDIGGTALVVALLAQQESYIEMAPYLAAYIDADKELALIDQEGVAVFARMIGLQFGVERDFAASRSWLERSVQLGDPEAAGYLAMQAKDMNEFEARSEVNEAEDPWTRPAHIGGVKHARESALSEAQDPLTDPSRLAELAMSENTDVRDGALLNPACPNEVRQASGLVFMFVIQRTDFRTGKYGTEILVTREDFTRDLACAEVEVLSGSGGAEDFEAILAADLRGFTDDEYASVDSQYLVWCGSGAPNWWSSWSVIEDFLGPDAVAAFARGDQSVFAENDFEAAERVAFADHEATATAWVQIRADLTTVFATGEDRESSRDVNKSSTQELNEVANRWLREGLWRELSETTYRSVVSALARHPNTPSAVLEELAVSDWESVRWLVTRNPSATDEIRAAAVLAGMDDDIFTDQLPEDNFTRVFYGGVHLAVHASAWTVEQFSERFPSVFSDSDSSWVSPTGRVAINTVARYASDLPEGMLDYLDAGPDEFEDETVAGVLYREYEFTNGCITEFETMQ